MNRFSVVVRPKPTGLWGGLFTWPGYQQLPNASVVPAGVSSRIYCGVQLRPLGWGEPALFWAPGSGHALCAVTCDRPGYVILAAGTMADVLARPHGPASCWHIDCWVIRTVAGLLLGMDVAPNVHRCSSTYQSLCWRSRSASGRSQLRNDPRSQRSLFGRAMDTVSRHGGRVRGDCHGTACCWAAGAPRSRARLRSRASELHDRGHCRGRGHVCWCVYVARPQRLSSSDCSVGSLGSGQRRVGTRR